MRRTCAARLFLPHSSSGQVPVADQIDAQIIRAAGAVEAEVQAREGGDDGVLVQRPFVHVGAFVVFGAFGVGQEGGQVVVVGGGVDEAWRGRSGWVLASSADVGAVFAACWAAESALSWSGFVVVLRLVLGFWRGAGSV